VSTTSITELSRHPDRKYVAQPEVDAPVRSGNWPPFIGHARALTVSAVSRATDNTEIYRDNNAKAWLSAATNVYIWRSKYPKRNISTISVNLYSSLL